MQLSSSVVIFCHEIALKVLHEKKKRSYISYSYIFYAQVYVFTLKKTIYILLLAKKNTNTPITRSNKQPITPPIIGPIGVVFSSLWDMGSTKITK